MRMFTKSYGAVQRRQKLNNRTVEIDGVKFQSKKEGDYYLSLKLQLQAGMIAGFDKQVPFQIIVNEVKVFKYIADFVVYHKDGRREVIDVKGYRGGSTYAIFRLKKKCVEAQFCVKIVEV
jgi:hypothetical protein